MAQRVLGPIIGGLTAHHVNLWARCDAPARLTAWLDSDPGFHAPRRYAASPCQNQDGFAAVVSIDDLQPETVYYYALTLDEAPRPNTPEGQFTTFPADGTPRSFRFAFGSCFLPTRPESGETFLRLEDARRELDLRFLLMLGDQIYADNPHGNHLGRVAISLDDYRSVYAWNFSRPPLQNLFKNLPAFMILDDHEVDDDWRWTDRTRLQARIPLTDRLARKLHGEADVACRLDRKRTLDALQAYWEHQAMHAPPLLVPLEKTSNGQFDFTKPGALAYTFEYGGAAFFVLDTRTMRVRGREHIMLDETQWQALEDWMVEVKTRYPVKFIISSSAVIFNMWIDIAQDRWPGFPQERKRLLSLLALHGMDHTYILTGDLHSGHIVSAQVRGPKGRPITVWEFCASPFEQSSNFLSKWSYRPRPQGILSRQKLHFIVQNWNFGVVDVNLDDAQHPRVRFDLHYRSPSGWRVHSQSTAMD